MKPGILAIVGPTAVGKTDAFLQLIQDGYDFTAVVADSRQVYKHLDIGTGKDVPVDPSLRSRFKLIDAVSPDQAFSSANFVSLARQAIESISASGSQPVIIGGTGRYIKDLETAPQTLYIPPDPALRQKLSSYTVRQLQEEFKKYNPQKYAQMNHSDQNNPRRLVRAIEISHSKHKPESEPTYRLNTMCLTAPLPVIEARIQSRVKSRIKQGMIEEVSQILDNYPDFESYQSSKTPGYQEIIQYLHKEVSLEDAIGQWTLREINYAKRQLTWFRHQADAAWFDISNTNWYAEILKQLEKWGYGRSHT
jgi:tRNA dimethylallyltransferase